MQLRSTFGRRRSSDSHRLLPHGRLADPRLRRLGIETLESRRLLSVFTVENLDDAGDGSLRAAIDAANANPGADTIDFAVAGTIYVQTELPELDDPTGGLLIDATTAPGYVPGDDPVVVLDGSEAISSPWWEKVTGLTVGSSDVEIRGLCVQWFTGTGIMNGGTLTVSHSIIAENSGGGVYNYGTLTLAGSTVSGNSTFMEGGGIDNSGTLTVTNSTVSGNTTHDGSGGIDNSGTLTLTNSTVSGNTTRFGSGGGIDNSRTLTVTNSTVSGNSAHNGSGGGIFNTATLTLTDSAVSGNAAHSGGGIYNYNGTLSVTNSTVSGNAAHSGGGIYNYNGTLTVTNSTVSGNSGSDRGGGIYNYNGTLTVINSTVSGNSADYDGGGIHNRGTLTLANSVVAGNEAPRRDPDVSGVLSPGSDYNLIGIWSEYAAPPGEHYLVGTEDVPLDPRLSDWTDLGGGVWGYLLLPGSPALGAGNNALAVDPDGVPLQTDQYGNPRIQDGVVDLGAMEGATEPSDPVTYVVEDLSGGITPDGSLSFQEAFQAANSNLPTGDAPAGSFDGSDQITFAEGLSGSVLLDGQTLAIYGDLVIDGPGAEFLTLDGQGAPGVLKTIAGTEVTLQGIAVTGGQAERGGGIVNRGTLTLTSATVSGNSASEDGGGIYNGGALTLTRSTVSGNSAGLYGGGILNHGKLTLINSTVSGNSAHLWLHGSAIYSPGGSLTVTNSTISGNTGGGIRTGKVLTLHNSIVVFNDGQDLSPGSASVNASNNLIGIDPGFVRNPSPGPDGQWRTEDDDPGDLHLTARSPAIDLGNNALAVDPQQNPLQFDFDGNPRIAGNAVDIGAYEFQGQMAPGRETARLVVDTPEDVVDLYDGAISLREAIFYVEYDQLAGPITFDASLDAGTIMLGGAALYLQQGVGIDASALSGLTLDAAGASSVVVNLGDAAELSGLTIRGGNGSGIHNSGTLTLTNSTVSATYGGGIRNSGTLTVTNSTVSDNSATYGGGIYNDGTLTVTNSTVSDNSATYGGGIRNSGTLTISNSTVSGNSATYGGGIDNSYGTLRVTDLTLSGNSADRDGGGIQNYHGNLALSNSTVSGNAASGSGGGIYIRYGTETVANSTISGNSGEEGGGIYIKEGRLTVYDTIVAGNVAGGEGPDIRGVIRDTSLHNLIGDGTAMWGIVHDQNGNLVGTEESPIDPRLGPLGDYGAATWTMPLLSDSPAVDAGDPEPSDPPPTDQRGAPRIVDGDEDGTARIDMGAFEYQPGESLVFGRHVFYNNSYFDTPTDEDPDFDDDTAIAPDKTALQPGGTATFENYTSYSGGINGIMVDVAGLAGTPTADDFEFRVGNDDNPAGWGDAPAPESVSVRPGEGVNGSDRVTIIWADNAIQKQWLQVTVLVTQNTGLEVPDVFYYGNAIGETGNSTVLPGIGDAKVNAIDMLGARDNQRNFFDPAPIDFRFDFDRNARVNATDMLIARNHTTHFLNALRLISVPLGKAGGRPITPATRQAASGRHWITWLDTQDVESNASRRPLTGNGRLDKLAIDMLLAGP